jgi:nucleoside-diphosphate-sugar epimerase
MSISFPPTKFTVLGGKGFIGSHLIARLKDDGQQVFAPNQITPEVLKTKLGNLIYCIGLTSDFRKRPLDTMQAHVCILRDLLEHAEFDSLTYLSSTRVYYGSDSTNVYASLRVNPENPEDLYNISKIAGESLCFHSGRQNVKIARLSNIVGYRNDSDLFIDQLLNEITANKVLTLKSSLSSEKDYLYIDDAVSTILFLATSTTAGCFNVASGNNISNLTIIEHLKAFFDFNLIISDNAQVINFMPIDISRIKNIFSYEPAQFTEFFPKFINLYKYYKGIN